MKKKIHSISTFKIDSNIFNCENISILSKNEEFILAKKFKEKNDLSAIKQLIESNIKYIIKIARKYDGYGIILKDLIQEGIIGFIKSIKKFDPNRNIRLISFAIYWIKSEIHEYIIKNLRIVKVANTKSQKKLFFNLKNFRKVDWLSESESIVISNLLNIQSSDVKYMESRLCKRDVSLDFNIKEKDFEFNRDFFFDQEPDTSFVIENDNWNKFLMKKLREALKNLDERSKNILKERWLLKKKSTLKKLAEKYNLSSERIRQLESNALKKVKVLMNLDCL